jgi:hypothetical protein
MTDSKQKEEFARPHVYAFKRRKQRKRARYYKKRIFDQSRHDEIKALCNKLAMTVEAAPAPWCKPLPSVERLETLIECDFNTGVVRAKVKRPRIAPGMVLGTPTHGYLQIYVDGVPYRLHRLIWKLYYGTDPQGHIDHIDGNRMNNAIGNLRDVLPMQNARNRRKTSRNSSGRLGVWYCRRTGLWSAEIGLNNRNLKLGKYEHLSCAIAARKCAERYLYGLKPDRQEAA